MISDARPHRPVDRRKSEAGIVWWVILIIVVVVVAVIVGAGLLYHYTKPSTTVTTTPRTCGGGTVDVKAHMRGASTGQSYTVNVTATRRCDLGQNCTCGTTSGSFGTPTTPCDQYDGNAGPVTSSDTVTADPLVTNYHKVLSNLREGVWEVQVTIQLPGQPTATKTCCVIVQSGQTSSLEYWCERVLLPGSPCPDCTTNTTPGGPAGQTPVQ